MTNHCWMGKKGMELTSGERVEITNNFIAEHHITDEDVCQTLYLESLKFECGGAAYHCHNKDCAIESLHSHLFQVLLHINTPSIEETVFGVSEEPVGVTLMVFEAILNPVGVRKRF